MTSSTRAGGTGPAHGDVLIARDKTEKKACTLSVVPGPPQMRCPTYEDAISTASAWASQKRVAIWFTKDGRIFTAVSPATKPAV